MLIKFHSNAKKQHIFTNTFTRDTCILGIVSTEETPFRTWLSHIKLRDGRTFPREYHFEKKID